MAIGKPISFRTDPAAYRQAIVQIFTEAGFKVKPYSKEKVGQHFVRIGVTPVKEPKDTDKKED